MVIVLIHLRIGNVGEDIKKLMRVTKESLYKGIEKAVAGNRLVILHMQYRNYTEEKMDME